MREWEKDLLHAGMTRAYTLLAKRNATRNENETRIVEFNIFRSGLCPFENLSEVGVVRMGIVG